MITTSTRLKRLLALGLVAGLGLAACGDDDEPQAAETGEPAAADAVLAGLAQAQVDRQAATQQYVGTVEGSGAYIAVVVLPDGTQKGGKAKVRKARCKELKADYKLLVQSINDTADPDLPWFDFLGDTMNEYAESGCVDVTGSISSPTT
jgi:hypothetical protein